MKLTVLSREQQKLSRRVVIGSIALVVMFALGWRIDDVRGASVAAQATIVHEVPAVHSAPQTKVHSLPPAFYSVFPFVALLLAIALLPLFRATEHWWERNWNRLLVAASLGGVVLLYYAVLYGHGVVDHATHHLSAVGWPAALTVLKNAMLVEYIPFIVLLFSLYVISGGIAIAGNLVGRPKLNATIIGIGGMLASFIGTTGAAMLLIRPLLKANQKRDHVAHTVIFFIFIVCNTGGCLLPIGDPPLFLGFLRGVKFTWTLSLWPMWLFMNALLLTVYFVWDTIRYRHEDRDCVEAPPATPVPFAIRGGVNFLWLIGVIAAVVLLDPSKAVPGTDWHAPIFFREMVMLGLAGLSLWSTTSDIRRQNAFNYDAILEVAALFIGIFICMQTPIQLLHVYGDDLGIDTAAKFYWGTGLLSSFLDNTPTYVVFFETAKSMGAEGTGIAGGASGIAGGASSIAGVWEPYLIGVSLGAVFMGAMTYIGNGPNFMVKAIAEKNNIRMPSFFGYMAYSCGILLPISIVLSWVFL